VHQRTIIQPMSADAMIATSYLSFGNVPEWKGVEIKYTPRAKQRSALSEVTAAAADRADSDPKPAAEYADDADQTRIHTGRGVRR
jgi:hypothetical protein